MQAQALAPAAVLVLWSLVVLVWAAVARKQGLDKAGMSLKTAPPGGRGQDLETVIEPRVNWKSHNYTHLMEQPTIFYAAVVILAIMGAGALDVLLAWAYVALRIVHSVWQATVNRIQLRLALFGLSTLCLLVLALRAVIATLFHDPMALAV